MNLQVLIDSIVRQMTVLIAQLSTARGLRAPLANVANQVFLDLAEELQQQGVSRKVSADMFGLALRTYLRKIQRLSESSTEQGRSLWQAVLEYLQKHDVLTRAEVLGVLAITDRTLVRRKKESRLQASESDRLFRLARVAALAVDVLEGEEKARRWLHKPNRALGGAVPLSLLSTDIGARQVEELLQRIDHGLFS